MTIEVKSDGENLIFEDYKDREVTIKIEDYYNLIFADERKAIRPILEDCLKNPSEVWWNVEKIEGKEYSYRKYIKVFSNLVFVAVVLMDEQLNLELNNFYAYKEDQFDLAEEERVGQLILSNLKS